MSRVNFQGRDQGTHLSDDYHDNIWIVKGYRWAFNAMQPCARRPVAQIESVYTNLIQITSVGSLAFQRRGNYSNFRGCDFK